MLQNLKMISRQNKTLSLTVALSLDLIWLHINKLPQRLCRAVATAADRERLRNWRTSWVEALAEARGIEADKLRFGLGLESMAVCDIDEDVVTLGAEAAWNLLQRAGLKPEELGRIYLGTESSVDAAKPSAAYIHGLIEQRWATEHGPRSLAHCDALDMTFACIGGVDALQNSLDWVRAGQGRKALVIASDVAKYAPGSPGEYTQGAGAVAMLVTESPRILVLDTAFAVAVESVSDSTSKRSSATHSPST